MKQIKAKTEEGHCEGNVIQQPFTRRFSLSAFLAGAEVDERDPVGKF